nr:MAG: maturation protein [Sanya fiers-like virus 28]
MYSQVKGEKEASLNVAVSLAEAPETIRMFTQALKAVGALMVGFSHMRRDFAKFLRGDRSTPFSNNRRLRWQQRRFLERRKSLTARDWIQVPASLWLLKQYGITPLLADIEGYRSYIQGKLIPPVTEDPTIFRAVGRKGRKQKMRYVISANEAFADGTKSDRALVSVSFKIRDADKAELTKLSTFSPLTVIYEKIPLSFVLDWVYNVGQWLELCEASLGAGLQFAHGFSTRGFSIRFVTTWSSVKMQSSGSFWQIGTTYYTGWSQWNFKERVVLTSFPKPLPPSVNVSLGSHRLLSAAALLKTLFIK